MKKRAVSSLLASLAAVSLILPALAAAPSDQKVEEASPPAAVETVEWSAIQLDGVPQKSVEYDIRNGTTYVTVKSFVAMVDPAAAVEQEYGVVTVSSAKTKQVVDAEGNTANVVQETLNMTAAAGTPYIVANGRYLYTKDALITVNNSVAAPIRVLAKVFNLDVSYDSGEHSALLSSGRWASEGTYIKSGDSYYDGNTLYWLSHIIFAESGDQVLAGKIAVGNVVMNRVKNPTFPNNIYDVLFQKNQFTPASTGSINRAPNESSVIAAKLVMDGAEVMPKALFFSQAGLPCYASRHRPYIATIGAHSFFA